MASSCSHIFVTRLEFSEGSNILSPSENWSLVENIQQHLCANKQYYLQTQLFNYNSTIFTCLLNYFKFPARYRNIRLEISSHIFWYPTGNLMYNWNLKIIYVYTKQKEYVIYSVPYCWFLPEHHTWFIGISFKFCKRECFPHWWQIWHNHCRQKIVVI